MQPLTAYTYASSGNEHYVLAPEPAANGHLVARTKDDALHGVVGWPGNVYELRIGPGDVIDQGPHVLRVAAYEVVRVLPRAEVFGRNVEQVDAILAQVGSGWMRPTRSDRGAVAVACVAEHYAALGSYLRVRAGEAKLVRSLDDVLPHLEGARPALDREGLDARTRALGASVHGVERRLRPPLREALMRVVAGLVVPAAWRASWQHVASAHLEYAIAFLRSGDGGAVLDDLGTSLIEAIGRALEAAMDPGLEEYAAAPSLIARAAKQECPRALARAQAQLAVEWGGAKPVRGTFIADLVSKVWFYAGRFTSNALMYVGGHVVHVASGIREPDPWAPWVAMIGAGLWPFADDGVNMIVYDPPMDHE